MVALSWWTKLLIPSDARRVGDAYSVRRRECNPIFCACTFYPSLACVISKVARGSYLVCEKRATSPGDEFLGLGLN